MTDCCGSRREPKRLTVHGCFDRGLGTRRLPVLSTAGERVSDAQGLWAELSLSVDGSRLTELRFRACACTTLIAYCQALCELLRARPLAEVASFETPMLIAQLPGVPRQRQDRAVLALAALRMALARIEPADVGSPTRTKEKMQ